MVGPAEPCKQTDMGGIRPVHAGVTRFINDRHEYRVGDTATSRHTLPSVESLATIAP